MLLTMVNALVNSSPHPASIMRLHVPLPCSVLYVTQVKFLSRSEHYSFV